MRTAEEQRRLERFNAECRLVVERVADLLTKADLDWLYELIDNNESPLAMNHLAWKIVQRNARVPKATLERIRTLAGEEETTVESWPPNLADFAI